MEEVDLVLEAEPEIMCVTPSYNIAESSCDPNCVPRCVPQCSPNCRPCFPYGKCNPDLFCGPCNPK